MRCYFLRRANRGRRDIALGLSDEDAVARAHTLSSKRKGPFYGFEVWDGARFIFRRPPATDPPEASQPRGDRSLVQ
jgi:hypothetical protein